MPDKLGVKHPPILKYEPRYCAELVAFMGQGYSLTAFAGEIGTSRANLMRWCVDHPPFAAALDRAQARRARLLEDRFLAARGANAFGAHMQALKTAAPDEWPAKGAPPATKEKARRKAAVKLALPDNGREPTES